MSNNGEFSVTLPDGAQFNYRSGDTKGTTEPIVDQSPQSPTQTKPRAPDQVEALRKQMQAAHSPDSYTLLPNTADIEKGVDPRKFAIKPEDLSFEDFFGKFSDKELNTVLESVERLGQTGVDESDPGNTFAHDVFDIFATAIKAKLADDLTSDDFQGSTLARKTTEIFSREFLGDLEKLRATLIRDPQLRNAATNLLAYLHKVANYLAPDDTDKPF